MFYAGARVLYRACIYGAAAFCANQALELLLKATLIYHDRSFDPGSARHRFASLLRALRNKVPGSGVVSVPPYFYEGQRYQSLARYPSGGRGFIVPAAFLEDLDRAFRELVELVPFQHNTQLRTSLASPDRRVRLQLTWANAEARALRRFLGVRVRRKE